MGIVAIKSTAITNRDAAPPVANSPLSQAGMMREVVAKFALATSDSLSSSYRLCEVPSNARISQILLSCETSGTVGSLDIGLWKNTKNGGAVVSQAFFASAQSTATALNNSDVTHESGTYTHDLTEKAIWDAAAVTADPITTYDIVAYLTAVTSSAAKCCLKVRYVL